MKQHEREFFIGLIRSGNVIVKKDNVKLVIRPITIEQNLEACEIYNDAYEQAYIDGIMSQSEMDEWMIENGLWNREDEEKIEGIKKDLEKLKTEIYNARNNVKLRERIRLYIRAGESQLAKHISKKHIYHQNTREGFAASEKIAWSIKNTTFYNNELYNFEHVSLPYVVEEWQASILTDNQVRDLARNEPWKSLWIIKDSSKLKLFNNADHAELTHNQKNIIVWSQMYDNIQESLECPPKDVIDDDDMLDGWFIIQAKKREQEKFKQEMENSTKNEKIKNASEVFVMTESKDDAQRIDLMNDAQALNIKKQRSAFIAKHGEVAHHNLPDERLKIQMQQTNSMRRKQ
jgi:hypothetical protein